MGMYDTEFELELELAAAPRRKEARTVESPHAATELSELQSSEVFFESAALAPEEQDLGQAVESKKQDNAALAETLVSIGLLERRELSEMRFSQAATSDLVGSLVVASAIRTRLGEILLRAKRITSSQLEFALELQRHRDGKLGEILVGLGWLDRETLDAALAAQAGRAVL